MLRILPRLWRQDSLNFFPDKFLKKILNRGAITREVESVLRSLRAAANRCFPGRTSQCFGIVEEGRIVTTGHLVKLHFRRNRNFYFRCVLTGKGNSEVLLEFIIIKTRVSREIKKKSLQTGEYGRVDPQYIGDLVGQTMWSSLNNRIRSISFRTVPKLRNRGWKTCELKNARIYICSRYSVTQVQVQLIRVIRLTGLVKTCLPDGSSRRMIL